jgi:hypothetical protein
MRPSSVAARAPVSGRQSTRRTTPTRTGRGNRAAPHVAILHLQPHSGVCPLERVPYRNRSHCAVMSRVHAARPLAPRGRPACLYCPRPTIREASAPHFRRSRSTCRRSRWGDSRLPTDLGDCGLRPQDRAPPRHHSAAPVTGEHAQPFQASMKLHKTRRIRVSSSRNGATRFRDWVERRPSLMSAIGRPFRSCVAISYDSTNDVCSRLHPGPRRGSSP